MRARSITNWSHKGLVPPVPGYTIELSSGRLKGLSASDPISLWADLSGNGNDATASGAGRPTYVSDDGNGNPGVNFTGGQFMTLTGVNLLQNSIGTLFIVAAQTSVSAGRKSLIGCSNTANCFQFELEGKKAAAFIQGAYTYKGGELPEDADTGVRINTYKRTGTGSGTSIINGNGIPLASDLDDPVNVTAQPTAFELGRRSVGSQEFEGIIYHLLYYPTALTAYEIWKVEDYLGNKYQKHLKKGLWLKWIGEADVPMGDEWGQAVQRAINGNIWTMMADTTGSNVILREFSRNPVDLQDWTQVDSDDLDGDLPASATEMAGMAIRSRWAYISSNSFPNSAKGWILKYDALTKTKVDEFPTPNNWAEGGDWRYVDGKPQLFVVYHKVLDCGVFDEAMNFIGTLDRPEQGRPTPVDNVSQDALWARDYLITPNHNAGGENLVDIHLFFNNKFYSMGRTPVRVSATVNKGKLAQGLCKDKLPYEVLGFGNYILMVRRRDDKPNPRNPDVMLIEIWTRRGIDGFYYDPEALPQQVSIGGVNVDIGGVPVEI